MGLTDLTTIVNITGDFIYNLDILYRGFVITWHVLLPEEATGMITNGTKKEKRKALFDNVALFPGDANVRPS